MEIKVNSESCIKCKRCVRICPSLIFSVNDDKSVTVDGVERCIACGHCVGICPTDSVTHSDFPATKVHDIDYSIMPSPEQLMMLLKARRSNRGFSSKPVPTELLDMILEAAHRAPTASNKQQVEFTLVTSPDKLHAISEFTVDTFSAVVSRLQNPLIKPILKLAMPAVYSYIPNFNRLANEWRNGNDLILRGAKAVILIHTPSDNRFGMQDANLAYQNGSLMAESLGVSQFYTGFVCSAEKQSKDDKLAKMLGINGVIQAGMALGMPDFKFKKYIDKKDIVVTRI